MRFYNHIDVQDAGEDNPLREDIQKAVEEMKDLDWHQAHPVLQNLLTKIREECWVGKELQPLYATVDGRSIPAPPTPLLVRVLTKNPDLIPFVLDHYLLSGGEQNSGRLLIHPGSHLRLQTIKAEKMDRLLTDLGYQGKELSDTERPAAYAYLFDSIKSELLEELFVYARQQMDFHQTKKTRANVEGLLTNLS